MNHGRIPIYKNLNLKKNTNNGKKKKENNLNLQDTKQNLAQLQKRNLILKNILVGSNKSRNRTMRGQQKETYGDITYIILNLLKATKSMNQFGKTEMKNQANIIRKQDNYLG